MKGDRERLEREVTGHPGSKDHQAAGVYISMSPVRSRALADTDGRSYGCSMVLQLQRFLPDVGRYMLPRLPHV